MGASSSSKRESAVEKMAIMGLANRLHMDRGELKELKVKFDELARRTGNPYTVDRAEFEEALALVGIVESDQIILQRTFDIFDKGDDGQMNFMDFVVGVSAFAINGSVLDRLKFSFDLFDLDNTGLISRAEMLSVLRSMHSTVSFFGQATLTDAQILQLVESVFTEADAAGKLVEGGRLSHTAYAEAVASHPVIVDYLCVLEASHAEQLGK